MLGSGSIVAMDDSTCMVRAAWRITRFFHRESCGQCTPAGRVRAGSRTSWRALEIGAGRDSDIDLLMDVCDNLAPGVNWPPQQTTICVLGPSIPSSVASGHPDVPRRVLGTREAGRMHRMADPTVTSHHAIAPSAAEGSTVGITLDGRELAGRRRAVPDRRRGGRRRLHSAVLLPPAHEAGRDVPDVPGRGDRTARRDPATGVLRGGDRRHGRGHDLRAGAKKAQDGVLEFLLVNHPLDCPVCDKGGECPLQDQTLAYGPGESRFIEEKRHFAKPIALSPLVLFDRERCIQCGRCTRFAAEIAGEPMIDFVGRGDEIEVAIAEGYVFDSVFSGNTVQICPVGALTSTPYRFTARPWDLDQVESTCTTCAVGCRAAVQSSTNRVTRLLGMDIRSRSTRAGCATREGSATRRSTRRSGSPSPRAFGRSRRRMLEIGGMVRGDLRSRPRGWLRSRRSDGAGVDRSDRRCAV